MRWMLLVASVLVFSVGGSLFLLTEQTDRYFAWTIANPLTAAFLGAGYWASGLLELLAARERYWREARIAVPAVLLFTVLTLFVTLLHRENFHFDSPELITRAGTWFWLGVYAVVPVVMGMLLIRIGWRAGGAPQVSRRLPLIARWLFAVQASVMVVLGALLLWDLETVAGVWPWELTPLTSRAIGAWILSIGVLAGQVVWENDVRRMRAATFSYVALAVLQFIAIARYREHVELGDAATWLYAVFLASILAVGTYVVLLDFRAVRAPAGYDRQASFSSRDRNVIAHDEEARRRRPPNVMG